MPDHSTETAPTAPKTPVSPKVRYSLLIGLLLTGLAAILSAITPDMLVFLGPYAAVAFMLVGVASQALAAYLKRDPLRDAGQAFAEADPPVTGPAVSAG